MKNEFKGWSDKVTFKVKNTGKNLTDETIYYTGFPEEEGLYEIYMDSEKKLGVYASSFTELQAKNINIKAHYVDKTPVKGQRHYVISQVNEKGAWLPAYKPCYWKTRL